MFLIYIYHDEAMAWEQVLKQGKELLALMWFQGLSNLCLCNSSIVSAGLFSLAFSKAGHLCTSV